VVADGAEGDGQKRVVLAEPGVDDRSGAPPLRAQVTQPRAAPVPLKVPVGGERQDRPSLGDGEQIGRHHRRPHAEQPVHAARRGVGHPVVVAQQPGGGATVQPGSFEVLRRECRRVSIDQGNEIVGDQSQLVGLGCPPHGSGRVHHRFGIRPLVVGPEQAVQLSSDARRRQQIGGVPLKGRESRPRAGRAGNLQRPVKPGETHPLGPGPALVVRPQPAHKLTIGRRCAEPVAEAALHDVVERAGARHDVVVDDQAHQAVALDCDRPVALPLDELPEEIVAYLEQEVFAVGGLAEREHARTAGE
jgi:hypothetical protein